MRSKLKKKKPDVVIVVSGGVVTGVYTKRKPTEVMLLDMDNIRMQDKPGLVDCDPLSEMDAELVDLVNQGYGDA